MGTTRSDEPDDSADAKQWLGDASPGLTHRSVESSLDVAALARRLLNLHGLHAWSFRYNRRKRSMGFCKYGARTIELSVHFVQRNSSAEILDTLLHEIAHALVGPGHGHDRVWKEKCRQLGARPERCGEADMPEGRWRGRCGTCGREFHRHRRPKRIRGWYCRTCGPESGAFVWRQAD